MLATKYKYIHNIQIIKDMQGYHCKHVYTSMHLPYLNSFIVFIKLDTFIVPKQEVWGNWE